MAISIIMTVAAIIVTCVLNNNFSLLLLSFLLLLSSLYLSLLLSLLFFSSFSKSTSPLIPLISKNYYYFSFQSSGFFHAQDGFFLKQNIGEEIPINVSVSRIHSKPKPFGLVTVRDISERKNAEMVLSSLARGASTAVGAEFFPCLVQHLALVFHARYAIVAEHLDSPVTRVRTLDFWMDDKLGENIEYGNTLAE